MALCGEEKVVRNKKEWWLDFASPRYLSIKKCSEENISHLGQVFIHLYFATC